MKNMDDNEKQYSVSQAAQQASKLYATQEKELQKKKKSILENAAVLITAISLGLLFVLYMYNTGVAQVYNIPVNCLSLDLKQYFSVASLFVPWTVCIIWYFSLFKSDKVLGIKRINYKRIILGFIILSGFLFRSHLYNYLGAIICLILPIIICIIIEFIRKVTFKPSNELIDKKDYDKRVRSFVEDFIFAGYYKTWVCIIIICAILSPLVGGISSKTKLDYQTFNFDSIDYVIITEESDRVLAQRVLIENDVLLINTEYYKYFEKNNLEISYDKYNSVKIGN